MFTHLENMETKDYVQGIDDHHALSLVPNSDNILTLRLFFVSWRGLPTTVEAQ